MKLEIPDTSYDPRYFELLDAVEDKHFWFRARGVLLETVARDITQHWRPGYRVLEVGCGNGHLLPHLASACPGGKVFGMDLYEEGLRHARRRGSVVRGDVHDFPFREGFHLIGMFDVLEHLPDDRQILLDLRRVLTAGGLLLITVPAHMSLWSYFDTGAHHCRRYSRAELRRKLTEAGIEVIYVTEFMAPLYPLVWLGRRIAWFFRTKRPDSDNVSELLTSEFRIRPVLNEILAFLLTLETPCIRRRWAIPFGTSLLAIARRAS